MIFLTKLIEQQTELIEDKVRALDNKGGHVR